jgi:subtilisin family serine protease
MKYQIAVKTKADYEAVMCCLTEPTNNEANIPDRAVECYDHELHSPTRAGVDLTAEEAEALKNDPRIKYVVLDPNENEGVNDPALAYHGYGSRFKSPKKIYRDLLSGTDVPPNTPGPAELGRQSWALKRIGIATNGDFFENPQPGGTNGGLYYEPQFGDANYNLTGEGVDVVIQDSGVLQYHPEFIDPETNQSRVYDIIIDGPYDIDPEWFEVNGFLQERPDGRVRPIVVQAIQWWRFGNNRSPQFANIGVLPGILDTNNYTEERALGARLDGLDQNQVGENSNGHGTACASLAAGRYFGIAPKARIWSAPCVDENAALFTGGAASVPLMFDAVKIWAANRPNRRPVVLNGSWGLGVSLNVGQLYPARFGGVDQNITITETPTTLAEAWTTGMINQGLVRFTPTSNLPNAFPNGVLSIQAQNEMIEEAGVIMCSSGGNNNQRFAAKQTDLHADDYLASFSGDLLLNGSRLDFSPQGAGYDPETDTYNSICVGAMDDELDTTTFAERKASYSQNGPGIDVWAPADSTLAAGITGDSITFERFNGGEFVDRYFNGTSAAAPVVAGLMCLYAQANPNATPKDAVAWVKRKGSVIVEDSQYFDEQPDDQQLDYWSGQYNLRGAERRILNNPYDNNIEATFGT